MCSVPLIFMQYRRFGRTELQVPVFSCGGMRYQYKWQDIPEKDIPVDNQINLELTIKSGLELGINHIETARGYGTSEMQLGKVLSTIERGKLIVQTKLSPKQNTKEFRQEFEKSLSYLKLDYVDLFGVHGINNRETFDYAMRPGGCLEMAKKLQAEGKIKHIGFSTHGSTEIITEAIETNQFDYVNLHWYWINQLNWPAIQAANKHDMGVFIISPSDKGGQLYSPSAKLLDLCSPLSPMVFNDLFCLSHPEVHTLSLGAAKPSDFQEHLKTLSLLDQAEDILKPILQRLEAEAIKCLGENWYKTWQVGLPKWEDTPNNINIWLILWLRNLVLAYDLVDYAKMRYNLLGNASHWFPGNKASNIKDVDLTYCLRNSPHQKIIPSLLLEADELLKGKEMKRLSES